MRFKDKNLIRPGDTFEYKCELTGVGSSGSIIANRNVMVIEVHTHHILVMDTEKPYLKYTLQNIDLLHNHIVESKDCVMRETVMGGALKFKDRSI